MKKKALKICGLGAAVIFVLITFSPVVFSAYECPCPDPGNLPDTCTPPLNPSSNFLGVYTVDDWMPGYTTYWVTQEYQWTLAAEITIDCCDDVNTSVPITVTQSSSASVTQTLEASFSFLDGMFGGSQTIGTVMGFSQEITLGPVTRTLDGRMCSKDIGQWYLKQTRLKIDYVWYDGAFRYGVGTLYSGWFDLISIQWKECHFPCPIRPESQAGESDGNCDCQDAVQI